jgi:hypothetical protein
MPLLRKVQTGSGAQPASYPVGSGFFLTEVKRPGPDDYSPSFTAEVMNEWNYTSTRTCLHGADRDLTFHLYRDNLSSLRPLRVRASHAALAAVAIHRRSGSTRFSSKPYTLISYHHSLNLKVLEMTSFDAGTSVTSNKHLSAARIIFMKKASRREMTSGHCQVRCPYLVYWR